MPDSPRTTPTTASDSEFMIRRKMQLSHEMARTTNNEREWLRILNRITEEQAKVRFAADAADQRPDDEDPGPTAA